MKKIFVHTLLLATVICSSFVVKAQTADEIIDKYITAIGGKDAWKKVNTMIIDGNIEAGGNLIPFKMQSVNGKGARVDVEFNGMKIIDIINPTNGWSQNPLAGKATIQPISEEELKERVDELDIQGAFIDYKEKGSSVEFLGKDEEDGNEYFKIKLITKNKNETTYFIDIKTYLVYKQESISKMNGQEVKKTIKSFDYQNIDGGLKVNMKTDTGEFIMAYTKVTLNQQIDEKIFTAN